MKQRKKKKKPKRSRPMIRCANTTDSETNGPVVGPVMPWLNQFNQDEDTSVWQPFVALLNVRSLLFNIFEHFIEYVRRNLF